MRETLKDVASLQREWNKLLESGRVTKRDICELCLPFKEKYNLTDMQALKVARNELSIEEVLGVFDGEALKGGAE